MFNFKRNYPEILTNRSFLKLWLSQLLSQPATHMLHFILAIRIFEITKSNLYVSLLVALLSIPPIIFSSTAGVLADSVNRKNILIFSNLLRAIVAVGLIFAGDSYFILLILAFIISSIAVFFGPAETSSIPALVKKENLITANTLFVFTLYAGFIIGYSMAGPLLYWFGDGIYVVLIIAYFLAALMDMLLPNLDQHLTQAKELEENIERGIKSSWRKLKEGVLYIKDNKAVLLIIIQITFVFSVERAFIALVPDFATNMLHFDISQISYFLITPVGLGALVGAYLANKMKTAKRKKITAGILMEAVVLVLLALYGWIKTVLADIPIDGRELSIILTAYVVVLVFFAGLGDLLIIVSAQTTLQEETHHQKRGRVYGNLGMLMNLVGLPLILAVGFIANSHPVTDIIMAFGAGTLVMGVVSWLIDAKYANTVKPL